MIVGLCGRCIKEVRGEQRSADFEKSPSLHRRDCFGCDALPGGCGGGCLSTTAQFFVNDFADVLSAQTEQEIVELGRALQQQTGAQAVAVTVPSLGGQSVEDYAIDLANSWGIGQAEEDNGVLILIAVEERKLRVEVGLGLEGALPDGKTGRIMDEYMTPSLRQNDYSTGMLEGYKAVASQIYQEYGIEAPELSGYEASNNQNTGNRQDIPLC